MVSMPPFASSSARTGLRWRMSATGSSMFFFATRSTKPQFFDVRSPPQAVWPITITTTTTLASWEAAPSRTLALAHWRASETANRRRSVCRHLSSRSRRLTSHPTRMRRRVRRRTRRRKGPNQARPGRATPWLGPGARTRGRIRAGAARGMASSSTDPRYCATAVRPCRFAGGADRACRPHLTARPWSPTNTADPAQRNAVSAAVPALTPRLSLTPQSVLSSNVVARPGRCSRPDADGGTAPDSEKLKICDSA